MKDSKPIIGITLDYRLDDEISRYSPYPWYALRFHYSEIIRDMGGVPIFIPFESYDKEDLISNLIDGLLIPGGDFDVPPKFYNQEILFEDVYPAEERSVAEFKLLEICFKKNMPIFGICHGMQLLNVYCGGSLIQNIKEQTSSDINHKQTTPKNQTHHNLLLNNDSKFYDLIEGDKTNIQINSYHRQAVDKLGKNLKATAVSSDLIIEMIESEIHDFVIGVQWHPEFLASSHNLDQVIFSSFINHTIKYKKKKF